jgi:hypothetical protein
VGFWNFGCWKCIGAWSLELGIDTPRITRTDH